MERFLSLLLLLFSHFGWSGVCAAAQLLAVRFNTKIRSCGGGEGMRKKSTLCQGKENLKQPKENNSQLKKRGWFSPIPPGVDTA